MDRRGSTKDKVMIYCKQCCMHIDIRDRDKVEANDHVSKKMVVATPVAQGLQCKLLDESTLTKDQIDRVFTVYTERMKVYMEKHALASTA